MTFSMGGGKRITINRGGAQMRNQDRSDRQKGMLVALLSGLSAKRVALKNPTIPIQ